MSEDLPSLKESTPLLNINLGQEILRNLSATLAEKTGNDAKEIEAVLKRFGDFTEKLALRLKADPDIAKKTYSKFLEGVTHLTGEEKALAAEDAVFQLLSGDSFLGPEPETNMYQVHSHNRLRTYDKSAWTLKEMAHSGEPWSDSWFQPTVGATTTRQPVVEILVKCVIDGPTDKKPYFTVNEREETYTDDQGFVRKRMRQFSGGGKSPQEWAREGFPILQVDMPWIRVGNFINSHQELADECKKVTAELKQTLGIPTIRAKRITNS